MDSRIDEIHTAMPGKVVSFNSTRNTVDVQPQFRQSTERADGTFEVEDLPVIPDVPIAWPRGGGGSA